MPKILLVRFFPDTVYIEMYTPSHGFLVTARLLFSLLFSIFPSNLQSSLGLLLWWPTSGNGPSSKGRAHNTDTTSTPHYTFRTGDFPPLSHRVRISETVQDMAKVAIGH